MVFVNKDVKLSGGSLQDVCQALVDQQTLVLHLVQHGVQHDHVLQHVLVEHIDLVEHHVCVQHQIVREAVLVARRFRVAGQHSFVFLHHVAGIA